ncbi:MAG: glycosidase [Lachnospiraceae bacterium]|nr:glycosidase [Lachnospiraceae bacterium]
MLNAYPDSLGGRLCEMNRLIASPEWLGAFQSFYILPSLYHSDLDRGFSVIDYGLNEEYAGRQDLEELNRLGIDLKLDLILNHASVNSPQFQDLLQNGEDSEYRDFFIDWNQFWEGCGEMTPEGYIFPRNELLQDMFFRKPGLPLLMVPFPDGRRVPYWNTFYQEVRPDGSFLGQMDLNINSPLVWSFYENTLKTLAGYGAKIVRLDAFAYADKRPRARNFLNEPGTWEVLARVQTIADKYSLTLLPEIHAGYDEKIYQILADKGYMTYDFFLPGLILDALERGNGETLLQWAEELFTRKIRTVNMLGCHDGIPLLDLKGLLPQERIEDLIRTVVGRGGDVKNLHGQKNVYYQVNAAYYSALGEDDDKLLLARAIQLFMPGKPQIWYLDLFAGKNDHAAVQRAGAGGHKEINRTNLTPEQIEERMKLPVVTKQLELLQFRNTFPAFGFEAAMEASLEGNHENLLTIGWENRGCKATLTADLSDCNFRIRASDDTGERMVMENRASAE